jgi:predicted aspartyl protease
MIYIYKCRPEKPLFKSEDMTKRIYLPLKVAPAGSGAMSRPITAQVDCGADNLVLPLAMLEQLNILDQLDIIGEVKTTLASGDQVKAKIALVDIQIPLRGYSPVLSGVEALILDNADEVLIGQDILNYYQYTVRDNELIVFKPDEQKIQALQPYNKKIADSIKTIRQIQLKLSGDESLIEPLKPITEKKKADGIEPPKVPTATDWAFPKNRQGLMPQMPTMPTPPKPGQAPQLQTSQLSQPKTFKK